MKRILAMLLCLALCLSGVNALAANSSGDFVQLLYQNQPHKMLLQYLGGSGVKGTLTFAAQGDAEWVKPIADISGVELQLRAINEVLSDYQLKLYVQEGDAETAVTEVFSNGGDTAWFRSDFLMGNVYRFNARQNMITGLTSMGRENPSWYAALVNMLAQIGEERWTTKWEPELESAYQLIDEWLAPYATAPEMLEVNGEKRMLVRYAVPGKDVVRQMKLLLPILLGNEQLTKLVNNMMTDEQAERYLHEGYLWYFNQLLDGLTLEGNVVLERQFTALGKDYSTLVTLPMTNNPAGIREITFMQEQDAMSLNLIQEQRTVLISAAPDKDDTMAGTVRVYEDAGENMALSFELNRAVSEYTDDKEREHQDYHWVLKVRPELAFLSANDPVSGAYKQFDPFTVDVNAQYYSKPGDTSAVTLKLNAEVTCQGSKAGVEATIKTASPWKVDAAYNGQTVDLEKMTDEQRADLFQDWLKNAMLAISGLRPEPADAPVDAATATDLTEVP